MTTNPNKMIPAPILREMGLCAYGPTWQAMREFTERRRTEPCADELWLLQHEPVFTQGSNGHAENVLAAGDIPIVQSDRGGQVTYHGPGQIMLYVLADIKRLGLGVRSLVSALENAMIATLQAYNIEACARRDAPGVYVDDAKIGSIGLRIRHGLCYHGLALNVDMDLEPFTRINPCGYQGLTMTQIADLAPGVNCDTAGRQLVTDLCQALGLPRATPTSDKHQNEQLA